jgi:hypothetical protein
MPESTRSLKSRKPTTPEEYPTRPPSPPPEYSSDTVLKLGGVLEAVTSLKATVKEQGDKLNSLSQELHGYKMGFRVLMGFTGILTASAAYLIKLYLDLVHPTLK